MYITLERGDRNHAIAPNPYNAFSNNSFNGFLMTGGMEYSAGLSKMSAKRH